MKQHVTTSTKPCPEWLEKLNMVRDEDLSPEERAELSKHLETCVHCRAIKAEYAVMDALILGLPRARPLPGLPTHLRNMMGKEVETEQPHSESRVEGDASMPPWHRPAPARAKAAQHSGSRLASKLNFAAAIVVVVALLGSLLLLFSTRQPGSVGTANNTLAPNFTPLYVVTVGQDGQTNKVLSALNPGNGHVLWQQKLDNALDGYGLSVQGNLYLPAQDGNVYAFRGNNGEPLWHTTVSHGLRGFTSVALFAYQNFIIAGITNRNNGNGDLYALNEQTGAVVWHTSITCAASPANDCVAGERLMLLANGILYGLAEDGLSAWNAANGHFLWRNPRYQVNGQPQSMIVSHGKVYITDFYPQVDVLDAGSGRFLHSLKPPASNVPETVVYDITADEMENTVDVLWGQSVSAYRANDDSLLWKQPFSYHSGGSIYAGTNGVYVNYYDISMGQRGTGSSGNNLYALRSGDGHVVWHSQSPLGSSGLYPVEFHGVVCFGGLTSVYGLRVGDGSQLWRFSKGGYVEGVFGG